jgi:hypothetical protein
MCSRPAAYTVIRREGSLRAGRSARRGEPPETGLCVTGRVTLPGGYGRCGRAW